MPPATAEHATVDGAAPAGFWQRYAAWSLDAAVLAIPTLLLAWPRTAATLPAWERFTASLSALFESMLHDVLDGISLMQVARAMLGDPALDAVSDQFRDALWSTLAWPVAVFVALALCWHVGFERSRWRGSPGKRALGLQVAAADGGPVSLLRSLLRFLAGTPSWLTLNIGHAMAALRPAHRALHDWLSRTRVITTSGKLPGWAKAWIWLQFVALLVANAWLLVQVDAAMQAVVEHSLYY